MRKIISQYYGLIPITLLCLFYIFKAIDFANHDFANYYFGGYFLAENNFNSNNYFPYYFNKQIADIGYSDIFVSYAPNTPFLALLFLPFTIFSLATAKLIFNCISVVLFVFSLKRLSDYYQVKSTYLLILPLLFFLPIKNELLFGQLYFLLFYLISESLLAYEKKQFTKMAFFLSIAIFLKVFPALLVLVFIFKKEIKPLLSTFVFCFSTLLIAIIFTGYDIWFFWLNSVVSRASKGEITSAYVDNYQSVFMFLKRLLVWNKFENPTALLNNSIYFKALIFAFKIGIIGISYYICKKIPDLLYAFAYIILVSILISPYGSTYSYILMIFPFILIVKNNFSVIKKILLLILIFIVNNLPLNYFLKNAFPFSYLRLLFFIIVLLLFTTLYHMKINWKTVTVSSIIGFYLIIYLDKNEPVYSSSFLKKPTPILMYDFKIENNNLIYYYWDNNGSNFKSIPYETISIDFLDVKNNQIFYNNKQISFDNSNKLKPILVNKRTIVYLTDFERGIGFYTLRQIPIN